MPPGELQTNFRHASYLINIHKQQQWQAWPKQSHRLKI